MRCSRCQKLILIALCVNVALFIYFAILQHFSFKTTDTDMAQLEKQSIIFEKFPYQQPIQFEENEISKVLTIVIREFEDFENYIILTIKHLQDLMRDINIVVISDKLPYPPLKSDPDLINVKFMTLDLKLERSANATSVSSLIKTDFTLFVPDRVSLISLSALHAMLKHFNTFQLVKALAVQTGSERLTCPEMIIKMKKWTLEIRDFGGSEGVCDFVKGDQAILLRTKDLAELPSPFSIPLSLSLYIQFAVRKWKTLVYKQKVFTSKSDFADPRSAWKYKHLQESRTKSLMQKFGFKQITYDLKKHVLYGCTKDTERCFGTVENDVPDFIFENKWTPPCCLHAVRETAKHVFKIFENSKVRYWLEGGSLLGAVRHKDIIPWDYDVDVGIYKDDIPKCSQLVKLLESGSFVDDGGFLWEKAEEGDFYRVHYSDINRNHVDIFPFYSRDGTMTKNTWFKTHKQDTEFPEHYLKPLTYIEFIGVNVSAPNNVKSFLEYKFGKGVIENPRYPNDMKVVVN